MQLLYAYNRWANARLVAAAATLSPELLHRDLAVSHRSIFGTLQHILWAEWRWLGRGQLRAPAGRDPLECRDFVALRERWTELEAEQLEYLQRLSAGDLDRPISYDNPPGTRWTYQLRHMLQHLVNHSTYHRGQVAAMLRQLDAAPPATDFLVYLDERAAETS
jgi:uncharacterized damage-inducible protein DinB